MAYIPYKPLIGSTSENVVPNFNTWLSKGTGLSPYINGSWDRTHPISPSTISPIGIRETPLSKVNLGSRVANPILPPANQPKNNFLKDNTPELRAAAGLVGNLATASKLDTNIDTKIVTNTPFTYKNRTGFLADANKSSFRNYMRMRTGMPANANQAYAATLEANNKVAAVEGERQDQAVQSYNNRDLQINATNAEAYNRNLYMNNMLKNNKTVQVGSAFTNYLQNLDTLDLQRNNIEKDNKALEIMGMGLNYGRADNLFGSLQKMFESKGIGLFSK